MTVPFDIAVQATGARAIGADRAPSLLLVATDSRTLQPGETFLALRGDRFDGHDYVAQAVAAGAARDRFGGRVVAVTGSAGKTTTKAMLAQLLESRWRVLATHANENNEIGVSKLLLAASSGEHDVLVVEMGARKPGDVAALVAIARPELGVLTNVGEAHLEIMGSRERLEETKWALFEGGARAVLNLADEASRRRASSLSSPPHWFYAGDAEPQSIPGPLCAIVGRERMLVVDESGARSEYAIEVHLPGAHNRANLAAAIAAALDLGLAPDAVVSAIPRLTLPAGRFERFALPNGARLIYDAYNASPSGTIAALDAIGEEPASRRIAVLGGMAELGDESAALHESTGARAAARADWLLAGGAFASATARGAANAGLARQRIVEYATNDEAAEWLRKHARDGDVVLLKGSRAYRLEEIVEELARA